MDTVQATDAAAHVDERLDKGPSLSRNENGDMTMDVNKNTPATNDEPIGHVTLSRKGLLRRAGVGASALVLGSALGTAPAAARGAAPAVHLARRTYRAAWVGGTCEASTYPAFAKHLGARAGINPET